jgi:hypothetical protein
MRAIKDREERARNVSAVELFFRLMHEKDIDAWASLWNEDGQILIPYLLRGFPKSIESRERIVSAFRELFVKVCTSVGSLLMPTHHSEALSPQSPPSTLIYRTGFGDEMTSWEKNGIRQI